MMTLGPFARKPLAACLLLCAIVMASPTGALAKDYIVNGQDGAEGDPTDGNDFIGGGSSDLIEPATTGTQPGYIYYRHLPGMIFFFDSPVISPYFKMSRITIVYRYGQEPREVLSEGRK